MAARNTRQNPPVTAETRARLSDANRARHQQRRAALADRLRPLSALTDREAAAVVGSSAPTVHGVRPSTTCPGPAAG